VREGWVIVLRQVWAKEAACEEVDFSKKWEK
jgi:hypothetical protein